MAARGERRRDGGESAGSFAALYTPKLISVWREGYGLSAFRGDAVAGLTVAIVALPLSMALAIASGVTPDRGLYAAIVGGFLVSALGGSRFQIGGPAGAFIVLVAATVDRHGVDGLLLATFMSGVMLAAIGWLRLGGYIRLIPFPVTVGFTAGIAIIIFASQLHDLFGLTLPGREPGPLLDKLFALGRAAGTVSVAATAVAAFTILVIIGVRRWRPSWPAMLIAVVAASLVTTALALDVETIGSRFGGIPSGLPMPALPAFSIAMMQAVLPDAIAFALLGSIESLLSAVVADGMTGRRHRPNAELVAQGVANMGTALFGGICVTGTLARTATNVRAGAHGPVAGMLHSVFLLAFMMLAAPLAAYVPLAALAGLLAVVAWTMFEKHEFAALLRSSWSDAAVLLVTFALVIFRDLLTGIVVGFIVAALLFIDRMSKSVSVGKGAGGDEPEAAYDPEMEQHPDLLVYRVDGALFFGAAANLGVALDRVAGPHTTFVLDCTAAPFIDSSAAHVIAGAARKAKRAGVRFVVAGASTAARRMLMAHGVRPPLVRYKASAGAARRAAAK
ncbi:MAG: SulP family inorganic anion transporter [Rhizobiaceae bacterium]